MRRAFPRSNINAISMYCFRRTPKSVKQYHSESNYVYLLNFGSFEKVLKVARVGDDALDKDVYVLRLLAAKGIPAPKIEFADFKGRVIPNHWIIMNKIGDKDLNQHQHRKDLYFEMGSLLAKIHKIKFERQGYITPKEVKAESQLEYATKVFDKSLNTLIENNLLSPKEVERARLIFSKFKTSTERSLCHSDFGPWQTLVDDRGISGVIDWEHARSGHSVHDFAKTEMLMGFWSKNIQHFREGYESVKKLPKDYDTRKKAYQLVEVMNLMVFFKDRPEPYGKCRRKFLQLIS